MVSVGAAQRTRAARPAAGEIDAATFAREHHTADRPLVVRGGALHFARFRAELTRDAVDSALDGVELDIVTDSLSTASSAQRARPSSAAACSRDPVHAAHAHARHGATREASARAALRARANDGSSREISLLEARVRTRRPGCTVSPASGYIAPGVRVGVPNGHRGIILR